MAQGHTAKAAAATLCREVVGLANAAGHGAQADNTTAAVFVFAEL